MKHEGADTQIHCTDTQSDSEFSSDNSDDSTASFGDVPSDVYYDGYEFLDDYVISELSSEHQCECGALSRGHRRTCPLSSRNRYSCRPGPLFPPDDPLHVPFNDTSSSLVPTKDFKVGPDKLDSQEPPPAKRRKAEPPFRVGDYVYIHSTTLEEYHLPCRIVQVFDESYKLCCQRGVIRTAYPGRDLIAMAPISNCSIPLDRWREAPKVSLHDIKGDPDCLEQCNCILTKSTPIDLSEDSNTESGSSDMWVKNSLYSLTHSDRKIILSGNWLTDKIIAAAQLLILQHAPTMHGLQNFVLQWLLHFEVHRGEFVQILHVGGNHWCTVSNIGCEDGAINVYDSMHYLISQETSHVFCVEVCI